MIAIPDFVNLSSLLTPSVDMIAIPDFVSGGMEHWGLITYRETYLLLDVDEASESSRYWVAVVVAHELAHMVILPRGVDPCFESGAIATSKFQPTDARRAFPCFDEPAFKANYTTSLVHPEDYIALSNMDVKVTEDYENGLEVTHFNPSVPMSTYLACFIVCQFEYKEMNTSSNIPFRVYAPKDVIDQVDYSLMIGVNITDFYEEYFDLGYPLPKLDMIAIPDFVSGAMEHWGLITYRETNLLYDEQGSSEGNKERVAAVVAHELAHMWFGNIVTCDWWDDLWLNEGFASYMEYPGVNSVEPEWKMLQGFVTTDLHYVMGLDQIVSSHPIIVEVNHPDEINEIFDSIPYSKGASVIRMLNNFLGESVFRAGVSEFLKFYQYGTAVTDNLWDKLSEAAAADGTIIDVKRVMDTWTLQMGFPVVTMEKVEDGGSYFLKGTQDWFLVDPNANKSADLYGSPYGDYIWEIPFHFRFKNDLGNEKREWIWRNNSEFMTPWVGDVGDFYVANTFRMGYYRVNYDPDTWNALGDQLQLNFVDIDETERAGIIDDAFNLARASQVDYSVALNMTKYLTLETEYVPWDTARDSLLWLGEIMRFQSGYGLYRRYIQDLTDAKYTELGWRDDGTHLEKYLRSNIIDLACRHGNTVCLDEAVRIFYEYLNGSTVSPDLMSDMFQFGMQKVGGQEEWKVLFENYQKSDVSQERTRLLYGMAQTRIPWILADYLDMLLVDNSPIRSQDFFSVVGYVGDNPVGNPIAWDWARVRWPEIVAKFGIGSRSLGRMMPGLTEFYSTELSLQEVCSRVKKAQFTGKTKLCMLIDRTVRRMPEARLYVSTPYFQGNVTALCVDNPLYDLVIGNITGVRKPGDEDQNWIYTEVSDGESSIKEDRSFCDGDPDEIKETPVREPSTPSSSEAT
nr:glutamyl aminopeptidase-like [Lytechinus pictus]